MTTGATTHRGLESGTAPPPAILVVDDEPVVRNALQLYFETVGYRVTVAEGGERAVEIVRGRSGDLDIVLLDLVMPGMHGIDVLKLVKEIDSTVEVIIATGCGSMNSAIEALRHGAYDYITKPIINLEDDLLEVVRGALASRREKLRGGDARSPAAGGGGVRVRESTELAYYCGLEALARIAAGSGSMRGALEAMGAFLLKQLRASAAFAVLPGEEGSPTCVAQWGELAGALVAGMAKGGPALLGRLLDAHAGRQGWQKAEPGSIPLGAGAGQQLEVDLEVLHVPLGGGGEERPARAGQGPALLALRPSRSRPAAVPVDTALLGLVAGKILSLAGSRR